MTPFNYILNGGNPLTPIPASEEAIISIAPKVPQNLVISGIFKSSQNILGWIHIPHVPWMLIDVGVYILVSWIVIWIWKNFYR